MRFSCFFLLAGVAGAFQATAPAWSMQQRTPCMQMSTTAPEEVTFIQPERVIRDDLPILYVCKWKQSIALAAFVRTFTVNKPHHQTDF